jgi:uncharacterized protein (DUF1499 family)
MIDFTTLSLPASPNTFLLCAPSVCPNAQSHHPGLEFPEPPAAVRAALMRVLDRQPRITIAAERADPIQIAYVQRSLVFRFADDVDVLLLPSPGGGTQLAVYSRSRVGYSDLGVNRARVEGLVTALREALSAVR